MKLDNQANARENQLIKYKYWKLQQLVYHEFLHMQEDQVEEEDMVLNLSIPKMPSETQQIPLSPSPIKKLASPSPSKRSRLLKTSFVGNEEEEDATSLFLRMLAE